MCKVHRNEETHALCDFLHQNEVLKKRLHEIADDKRITMDYKVSFLRRLVQDLIDQDYFRAAEEKVPQTEAAPPINPTSLQHIAWQDLIDGTAAREQEPEHENKEPE
jgi:hypothetical protein